MQIVDVNVLLYAVNEDAVHHDAAKRWLQGSLVANRPVGFAWAVLLGFVRISTKPSIFASPLTVDEAGSVVEYWLSQPTAVVVHPTARHLDILRGFLTEAGTGGNLVTDAHLAALATEHGAEIVSFDADFNRFKGVRCSVPEPV